MPRKPTGVGVGNGEGSRETQFGGPRDPGLDTRIGQPNGPIPPHPGRPTKLSDPEFCKLFAEAVCTGITMKALAEEFDISYDTARRWRRDPRVKAHALKMIEDRVIQITRKVDSVIEERLLHANEMSTKELIELRKEYLGGALRTQTEKADDETTSAAMDLLEKNPGLAAQMIELLNGKMPEADPDIPVTTEAHVEG